MIRTVWKNGCAVLLAAWVLLAGLLPVPAARAAQVQTLPDSGMALDVSELTLEMTDDDPRPVAYLSVQAPEEYFFLIWTSSNPAAATVDGTGKVTGRAEGTAVITACNERGEKAACTITVKKGTASHPVLSQTEAALTITEKVPSPTLRLTLQQTSGAFVYVRQWTTSNLAVARVSADGVVTAVGDGETVIMAITPEGRADACYVAVGAAAWRYRSEEELTEVLTVSGQLPYSDGK